MNKDAVEYYATPDALVEIYYTHDPDSPRSGGDVCEMWCWHSRYMLGDRRNRPEVIPSREDLSEDPDVLAFAPLYLYDHSGISISMGDFKDRWDSGRLGWAVVRKSNLEELGWADEDMRDTSHLQDIIEQEVKVYDQYLRGQVYSFKVYRGAPDDEDDDFGEYPGQYYGSDHQESGLLSDALGASCREATRVQKKDVPGVLLALRDRYEAAPRPCHLRLPDFDTEGRFYEVPFTSIAEARSYCAHWFKDRGTQDIFLVVPK